MRKTLLFLVLLPTVAFGQFTTPKYSNEFLQIGVGARALGMGNAQVAATNDVTASYWNPAALTRIESKYQGAAMHAEYFAGIAAYDYVGLAAQIDSVSTLGASFIRFGVDDIPDTRFLYDANGRINYDNIRSFSVADYALLLSYARRDLLPGLRLGANFKVVHRNVGIFGNAWGFGLDAGAQYEWKGVQLGLMVRDITGTFNAWSFNTAEVELINAADSNNVVPENSVEVTVPRAILGVSYPFRIKEKFGVQPSLDLAFTFDGERNTLVGSSFSSIDPRIGLELDFRRIVFLRGGINNIQEVQEFGSTPDNPDTFTEFQPNFGVGIRFSRFTVDYALTDVGDQAESLYSNIFSLKVSL